MRTPARPTRRIARPLSTTVAALAVVAAGLTGLAGCSDGGDDGESAERGGLGRRHPAATPGSDEPAAGGEAARDTGKTVTEAAAVMPAVQDRKLARRANIALTVPDVDTAAGRCARLPQPLVASSSPRPSRASRSSPELGGFSTITISVPTDALDETLDRLAAVGEVHSRNTSTEDVTGQYVDTQSRVKTMEASVERVRALMAEATRLADIVSLEAELSRRQADLESLQAQLAALEDAVDLAPIEVTLSTDETALEDRDDDTGFLAGLAAGWDAFTTSVTVLLTALGALLPFAVLAALVAVPLLVWWRRRGTRPVASGRAPGAPQRLTQRAETSWTRSTTRVRTSGSVSGRTPWPRLKMWPGAARPSSTICRTLRASGSQGANSRAGSRFPCTAYRPPSRSSASARDTR